MGTVFLVPLQLPAAIGEWISQLMILGFNGLFRAYTRKLSEKGRRLLQSARFFCGESLVKIFSNPGHDIGDHMSTILWAPTHWSRRSRRENLLLSNVTNEELEKGEVSDARIASIELQNISNLYRAPIFLQLALAVSVLWIMRISLNDYEFALSLLFAPLARLQAELWEYDHSAGYGLGSLLFKRNVGLFRTFAALSSILAAVCVYRFGAHEGTLAALRCYFVASIIQFPLYALLKMVFPFEILLVPATLVGIGFSLKIFVMQ